MKSPLWIKEPSAALLNDLPTCPTKTGNNAAAGTACSLLGSCTTAAPAASVALFCWTFAPTGRNASCKRSFPTIDVHRKGTVISSAENLAYQSNTASYTPKRLNIYIYIYIPSWEGIRPQTPRTPPSPVGLETSKIWNTWLYKRNPFITHRISYFGGLQEWGILESWIVGFLYIA